MPAISIAVVIFFLKYDKPLHIFPSNDTFFEYTALSDKTSKEGNTITTVDTSENHLHFSYNLDSKAEYPYAMLLFHAHEFSQAIDLKKYRFINMEINPIKTDDFVFSIYMYVPGFSDPGLTETHRPYIIKYITHENQSKYKYHLKSLATPGWWFSINKTSDEALPPTNWKKMTHLSLSDCGTGQSDTTLHISISKLEFTDSFSIELLFALLPALLYIALYYLARKYLRKRKNKQIKQKIYHQISKKSYTVTEAELVIAFIREHFRNPLLSLKTIKEKTGYNHFQINEILMDNHNINYKQYLNKLRIKEAKKLLLNTSIPINLIAEKVGFCYSNSFSRTFRQFENMTPTQYRKKLQRSKESG